MLTRNLYRITGIVALASVLSVTDVAAQTRLPTRPGPRAVESIADAQFEALPLERSPQNHLLVRAFINGKPAILGVDSGAPISAIATNRRAYFGMRPVGAGGEIPRRLKINGAYNNVVVAHTLRLGSLNLVDEPMVAIGLGNSTQPGRILRDQEIDGILGADVLFPTSAVLDCQAQTLILKMDPKIPGGPPGMDYRGLRGIPIHVSPGHNLYVDGAVNGTATRLLVDTGAFATLLHRPFVRRMQIPLRDTAFSSAGVNLRQRGVSLATIRRLSIGGVELQGKEVGVTDLEGLIHGGLLDAKPPVAGLLGSEILRRHHGIIDFGTRTLYLGL